MSPPSVAKVEAEEVDGEVLLEYERKDLKDDLGLKAGALAKLWKAVEALLTHAATLYTKALQKSGIEVRGPAGICLACVPLY